MVNILFVCKWNRFRSKVAEAFFKRYNKNKRHIAKSAGVIKGHLPLDKYEVEEAKEYGIKLKGGPKGLTSKLMNRQDIIVIVADDVPHVFFEDNKNHGKKTVVWKIRDNKYNGKQEIRGIIESIDNKVKSFVRELK